MIYVLLLVKRKKGKKNNREFVSFQTPFLFPVHRGRFQLESHLEPEILVGLIRDWGACVESLHCSFSKNCGDRRREKKPLFISHLEKGKTKKKTQIYKPENGSNGVEKRGEFLRKEKTKTGH